MENKVIKGSIEYTLTIEPTGHVTTEYESTIEGDLAALCIAQFLMENACVGIKEIRKGLKDTQKKVFTQNLAKAIAGREGLKVVIDQLIGSYADFKKGQDLVIEQVEPTQQEKDAIVKAFESGNMHNINLNNETN